MNVIYGVILPSLSRIRRGRLQPLAEDAVWINFVFTQSGTAIDPGPDNTPPTFGSPRICVNLVSGVARL